MPTSFLPSSRPLPAVVWLIALLCPVFLLFPVAALLFEVPWSQFASILAEPETIDALKISLWAGMQATLIAVILAVPLGAVIHAIPKGQWIVRLLVFLPLALPPVVAGLALTSATRALNLPLPFTFPAVVIAHVFVILPYAAIAIDTSLGSLKQSVLISAESLGIPTTTIFRRIILPSITPGILSAAALSFARSLGEFGTTVTFAGTYPGITRTLTSSIYLERELHPDRAFVLAALLIGISLIFLVIALLPYALRRRPVPKPVRLEPMARQRLNHLCLPSRCPEDLEVRWQNQTYQFPAGKVTAVIGPNGCGKSTLAGLIAGALEGADVYAGTTELSDLPLRQRGIVIVPQEPSLPPTTTPLEAVAMALLSKSNSVPKSATAIHDCAQEILVAAGLGSISNTPVPSLSGGQNAQATLARALVVRPEVLVLDEPFAPLDSISRQSWQRLITDGIGTRTVVLITHNATDVENMADWVIVMKDGMLAAQGHPATPTIRHHIDSPR